MKRRLPYLSFALLALIVIGGVFAPLLGLANPDTQVLQNALLGPSVHHLFGTDELGRDVFSRVVWGIRPLGVVSVVGVALGGSIGTAYGLIAGSARGAVEAAMMRLADIMLSIPPIVLAVVLALIFSAGEKSAIVAITLVLWPQFARVTRADTITVLASDYCQLARVAGMRPTKIIRTHALPNIMPIVVVLGTLSFGTAILVSSALSFLGLGTEPPRPDWGNMLAEATQYPSAWWMLVFPGIALTLAVLALNSVGDWLRDALDPGMGATAGPVDASSAGALQLSGAGVGGSAVAPFDRRDG
jgi:peptide/nickel transport system permease protein